MQENTPNTGISAGCPNCRISIKVVSSPPPLVCPFCQGTLRRRPYALPDPGPEPEETRQVVEPRRMYRSPPRIVASVLGILSIILLSVAAYLKLYSVQFYWYQPLVNLYSLSVGVFILSRFLLAVFYVPPKDVGYEPTVSVCVACHNEEDDIQKTVSRIFSEGYPHSKLEVVVVNDGSTDNTLSEMLHAQARHKRLTIVDFEANKGKRHGMAAGALMSRSEILVYVDSDSFLMPGSIRKVVQGMADPTVAGVSGHTDVENISTNLLTKMQDVRYYVSYRVMKAAEHLFGAVSCCPGCFSAYRRACVIPILDGWLHQRFLGKYATYGDDRSLTNKLLRHYKILYDDEALATTIVPDRWGKYVRQQARWKRSWIRELFFAGKWFWRKHPIAAISWYAQAVLPLLAPLVMLNALVLGPLMYSHPAGFYVGGVLVVTLLWSVYYLEKTGRKDWWAGFMFTLTYVFFFSWQGYYALFTLRRTSWGTR
ncbi:MAG: glycosyltransferase [Verrucomicrobiota bacterium]